MRGVSVYATESETLAPLRGGAARLWRAARSDALKSGGCLINAPAPWPPVVSHRESAFI